MDDPGQSRAGRYAQLRRLGASVLLLVALGFPGVAAAALPRRVFLVRAPHQGIQPQAASDTRGLVHLIYFEGDPGGGDIFYVCQSAAQASFSKPIRVNSRPHTAMALGSIRGAQLALGENGRVHVIWNGAGKGAAPVTINGKQATPLYYTRLNQAGTAFEPERNLITYAAGLDGGSTVAADSQGHVYALWQARRPGGPDGEAGRALFLARSSDDGASFQTEVQALSEPTGACPCCGMRAFADSTGAIYALFRAADGGPDRNELLLVASKPGAEFRVAGEYKWRTSTCPMSSASLSAAHGGALAAWETAGQVYCATVNPRTLHVSRPLSPVGGQTKKHPVAVANQEGGILLVWLEGNGWAKGGELAWQVYGPDGQPAGDRGRADGVAPWSLATAYAKPNGDFVIIY
jgi:hypothetical protein